MSKNKTSPDNRRTKYGIFYKSHGSFTGPWAGRLLSKKSLSAMVNSGELSWLQNDFLKSKLEVRPKRVRV